MAPAVGKEGMAQRLTYRKRCQWVLSPGVRTYITNFHFIADGTIYRLRAADDAFGDAMEIVDVRLNPGVVADGEGATARKRRKISAAVENHIYPSALMGHYGALRDMAAFGESLSSTDMARMAVQREKTLLEKEKHEID